MAQIGTHNCTHELGHIRQDVYACLSCMTRARDGKLILSGFCASCRLSCHSHHLANVLELYTKRNFKCDCGNRRMENSCILSPKDNTLNEDNIYTHNFAGRYCRCGLPYGSPSEIRAGPMYQCVMCEDWYHTACLKLKNKEALSHLGNTLVEFICKECVSDISLLQEYYPQLGILKPKSMRVKRGSRQQSMCTRPKVQVKGIENCDLFFEGGFRGKLCVCQDCKELYEQLEVSYLIDKEELMCAQVGGGLEETQDSAAIESSIRTNGQRRSARISSQRGEYMSDGEKWAAMELEMRDFFWAEALRGDITPKTIRKFMVGIKGLLTDLGSC